MGRYSAAVLRASPVWCVDYIPPILIFYGSCPMPVLPGMRWPRCARPMPGCVR